MLKDKSLIVFGTAGVLVLVLGVLGVSYAYAQGPVPPAEADISSAQKVSPAAGCWTTSALGGRFGAGAPSQRRPLGSLG